VHQVFLSYVTLILAIVGVVYIGSDLVLRRQLTDAAAQELARNLSFTRAFYEQSDNLVLDPVPGFVPGEVPAPAEYEGSGVLRGVRA
jgi:hypothetical protein